MTILASGETSIEKWHRIHPGVGLMPWTNAVLALNDIQSDWAYRHGPLNLPEKYSGQHGWWL